MRFALASTAFAFAAAQEGLYTYNNLDFSLGLDPPISDLNTVQYNSIIAGIAWGFSEQEGLVGIDACVKDAKTEALLAWDAFVHLHHGEWAAGMTEIKNIIADLPNLEYTCTHIAADIAILEAWALNLEAQPDIEAYIKGRVKRHIIALTADLATARSLYSQGEYFQFGVELGIMGSIATNK